MAIDANGYKALLTGKNEYLKQYFAYDGYSRLEYVYEARANADHGDVCLRTQYEYDGVSTRVVKLKESEATWDSSWDI